MIEIDDVKRSAVVFDVPPWRFLSMAPRRDIRSAERVLGFSTRYLLMLQDSPDPPDVPDFTLVKNSYNFKPIEVCGNIIEWYTPGYGYALYQPDGSAVRD